LLEALVTRSPDQVIGILDEMEQSGVSMQDVAEKTATIARHGFIVRDVGSDHVDFKALGLDDEETRHLNEIAQKAGPADLNRIFRTLARSRSELDGSTLDRYVIENYCLEWCLDPGILLQGARIQQTPTKIQPTGQISAAKTVAHIRESLHTKPATPTARLENENPSVVTPIAPLTVTPVPPTPEKMTPAPVAQQLSQSTSKTLPNTWRDLVEIWKKHKPLQAKRLEDVHPVTYSASKIELVIPSESFLSAALLKADEQKKLKDAFNELFGFGGVIIITAKKGAIANDTPDQAALPETLAVIQQREAAEKREKIVADAQNNPLTKDALNLFNATIESIEVNS
jgi:DNA polymerase III gamma/tau subunit